MKKFLENWILASRPKTLPAAIAPAVIGNVLAFKDGFYNVWLGISCVLIALIMQILANVANDLFDHEKGTDTPNRLGPVRATASGLISPKEMRIAILALIGAAGALAIPLVLERGLMVLGLGAVIVVCALLYSGGKNAYGYHGLGDLFVFIFFGLMATIGTYYMITARFSLESVIYAITQGALIVNILVVNNTRDRFTDEATGKNTLAVKMGRSAMNKEFAINLLVAYGLAVALPFFVQAKFATWLVLLSVPLAYQNYVHFLAIEGKQLNPVLAETARLTIVFAILLSLGLLLGF